jgi:predicted transcriptional regulator
MTFKDMRTKARLSQRKLAALAAVDQTTISKIEIGDVRDPRYSTVDSLARVLGTTAPKLAKVIARGAEAA